MSVIIFCFVSVEGQTGDEDDSGTRIDWKVCISSSNSFSAEAFTHCIKHNRPFVQHTETLPQFTAANPSIRRQMQRAAKTHVHRRLHFLDILYSYENVLEVWMPPFLKLGSERESQQSWKKGKGKSSETCFKTADQLHLCVQMTDILIELFIRIGIQYSGRRRQLTNAILYDDIKI